MSATPSNPTTAHLYDGGHPVALVSSAFGVPQPQSLAALYGFAPQQPQGLLFQVADPVAQRAQVARTFFTTGRGNGWHNDLDLPHGYVASFGGPHIHLRGDPHFPEDQRQLAQGNVAKWTPEGAKVPHYQRSPFYAVDNLCVRVIDGQPHIVCGYWKKEKEIRGGRRALIHGLVLAAGGHVEITGRPEAVITEYIGSGYNNSSTLQFKEKGHMSEREAADAEMKEEICVDRRNVLYTERVCSYESPLRDPRSHYQGAVYFRYLAIPPAASAELKSVVLLNLPTIMQLINRIPVRIPRPDNTVEECLFALGHDVLLDTVLRLPNVVELLNKCTAFAAQYGQ